MTTESSAHPRKEGHIKARPIRASELVLLFQTLTLLFQIFPSYWVFQNNSAPAKK